ncbi:MAG: DUF3662 and FHA domain-containing protein [Actinomycetota bacterium]
MAILRDFERRLEGIVEGSFAKVFRGGLQPVELAKRVLREMDSGKTVGVREIWAPNRFAFTVSQADHERFQQAEGALADELQQVCREHAIERNWGLLGPPEVTFEVDDALGKGRFRCAAALVEGAERLEPWKMQQAPPAAAAATPAMGTGLGEPHGPVVLAFLDDSGAAAGKTVRIQKPKVTIGRLPECDVVVSDVGASRHHAQIEQRDGAYVLSDLGSTNGTLVNDQPVTTYRLQLGDRITIGETVLEVRGD